MPDARWNDPPEYDDRDRGDGRPRVYGEREPDDHDPRDSLTPHATEARAVARGWRLAGKRAGVHVNRGNVAGRTERSEGVQRGFENCQAPEDANPRPAPHVRDVAAGSGRSP